MARIRSIKPEFWSSEQVMSCSRDGRLLFIGLWNFVDDAGRITNSAKSIKAQVFPGDEDLDSESVRRLLDELSTKDLLREYEVDGRTYLQITGWHHQKIDRPRISKIPPPPIVDPSTIARRALATDLTLSNPTRSDLRSSGVGTAGANPTEQIPKPVAGSLATALPAGARASQGDTDPATTSAVDPRINPVRAQLEATHWRKRAPNLASLPACPCCFGWKLVPMRKTA